MDTCFDKPSDAFFAEGVSYYRSGQIIQNSDERIGDEDFLFSPITYLFRHSVELLLKALILKIICNENPDTWFSIKFPPSNRKISSIHSVETLYEICKSKKLFNSQESELDFEFDMEQIISRLNSLDFSSTFFRYPYDKEGKRNKKRLTEEIDEDLLSSMPCCLGAFVYHKGIENFACLHREQLMDTLEEDLSVLIEYLMNCYEQLEV